MPDNIELLQTTILPEQYIGQAANLAYIAFESFYDLFTTDKKILLKAIGRQFRSYSELNQTVAAISHGELAGICCYYDLAEMSNRQMASMHALLEVTEDRKSLTPALRKFMQHFSSPGDNGGYIANLSISPEKQGTGLAMILLNEAESMMLRSDLKQVRLHVRYDNHRALSFYSNAGYKILDNRQLNNILLSKDIVPS